MPDKKEEKSYICKIKISARKRQEIEACAKAKGITFNRFIKDAINQNLIEYKTQMSDNEILRNQLELFDVDGYFKSGAQLDIDL